MKEHKNQMNEVGIPISLPSILKEVYMPTGLLIRYHITSVSSPCMCPGQLAKAQ